MTRRPPRHRRPPRRFIHTFVLSSGERLPVLVDRQTGEVCQLAARWAILARRDRVAASTILADQRALRFLYDWADVALPCPFDAYVLGGQVLTRAHLLGLAHYIKTDGRPVVAAAIRPAPNQAPGQETALPGDRDAARSAQSPPVFNNHWSKIELFIHWALGLYMPDDDGQRGSHAAIAEARERMDVLFGAQYVGEPIAALTRVLDHDHLAALRRVIDTNRPDVWPDPGVRDRNALMVYLVLNTGLRTGELLTLTLNQLPRGRQDYLVVKRRPDDRSDPRREAPQVKTLERELFVPRWLRHWIARYVTEVRPRSRSPFLFLAQDGRPLSPRRARSIMTQIARHSGRAIAWHDLRHTFLDDFYMSVADRDDGCDLLKDVAGWSSIASAEPYIRLARKRIADGILRSYQRRLFAPNGVGGPEMMEADP